MQARSGPHYTLAARFCACAWAILQKSIMLGKSLARLGIAKMQEIADSLKQFLLSQQIAIDASSCAWKLANCHKQPRCQHVPRTAKAVNGNRGEIGGKIKTFTHRPNVRNVRDQC